MQASLMKLFEELIREAYGSQYVIPVYLPITHGRRISK